MQLAEGAIAGFRTNYTTAPANAEMLVLAVQLLNSVSMLLHGGLALLMLILLPAAWCVITGQGRVDTMLKETMLFATQQRYDALVAAAEPSGATRRLCACPCSTLHLLLRHSGGVGTVG